MDKHEAQMQRGEEASRILNSQLFSQAFEEVRAAYIKTWQELPTSDDENARDIHRSLKCLERVRKDLEHHISTGRLIAKELSMREKVGRGVQKTLNAFARNDRNRL